MSANKKARTTRGTTGIDRKARAAIDSLLAGGHPTVVRASRAIGTSVRTLQRHLARSGLSHSRLVDEVRHQKARDLLRDPGLRIIDVTDRLGYADPGSFTRAFERWTGVAPSVYRRLAMQGDAGRGATRHPLPPQHSRGVKWQAVPRRLK